MSSSYEIRVPEALMFAHLPYWVKMVWISVRSFQGRGEACYAKYEMIGERAMNEAGKAMDKGQVSRAINTLIDAGFLVRISGRSVRCIEPGKVDEGSTFYTENSPAKVDHPSTKVDQGSTKVDEGSTPSKNQHRKPKLKTNKSIGGETFLPDSWQMVFASTAFDRLNKLGKLPGSLARDRDKTVGQFADVFDKLHRIDGHPRDEIAAVMAWVLREESWWIKTNNLRSIVKLRDKHRDGSTYYEIFKLQHEADRNGNHHNRPTPSRTDSGRTGGTPVRGGHAVQPGRYDYLVTGRGRAAGMDRRDGAGGDPATVPAGAPAAQLRRVV